ncbi:MAG TPA: Bax inhibitor-1 family protein, partial [Urbifossiella sp.]|nr:Bax inhibitor-1 family protein [Urbifossiella sp.]
AKYANVPLEAGMVTLLVFGGLTAGVFISGKDFSFLGPIVSVGAMLALGLVIAAVVFGFSLGLFFSVAMVGLAAAAIIYHTSNIMHYYGPDEHVAASLALFASVATMFWYIMRIFMATRDD